MYLEGAQLLQLAGALLAGLIIFVAAYAAPLRVSVAILLIMIPFQPIATSYGSANVIMTYVLAGALLLNGRLKYAPMLGSILPVLFAFMITISQLPTIDLRAPRDRDDFPRGRLPRIHRGLQPCA